VAGDGERCRFEQRITRATSVEWALQRAAWAMLVEDMGFDVLRDFWAEISRKLKLPFRGEREIACPEAVPSGN